MKFIDEFRDPRLAGKLAEKIRKISLRRVNLMEVCGTHTVAVFRHGLKDMLPPGIGLLSGPGCPVCVTSQRDIDSMIKLAGEKRVIIATFGDMMKVPGTFSSLEKEKALGRDIRVVYSPSESLAMARDNPGKKVIFLGIGFETTSPLIASCVLDAERMDFKNYFILSSHKLVPPAMRALMEKGESKIDGFLCPGHVSVTIGSDAYDFISEKYRIPCVVAGFEPLDVLQGIYMLLRQVNRSENRVEIQYTRAVSRKGNEHLRKLMDEVFEKTDVEWRGLGVIKNSGLRLKRKFLRFDARSNFDMKTPGSRENKKCSCGEILKGAKKPFECKLFAKTCKPENPFGPCMVSTEGACATYYKYRA